MSDSSVAVREAYDFPVSLQPLFTMNPVAGGDDTIQKRKAVVRQDTGHVLGIVSDKYELLEHKDVINGFRKALEGYEYTEKIQLAKNGAQMFATFKLDTVKVEVKQGDLLSLQFIVKNSYDSTNALQIMLGAFRLVCSNGMVIGKEFFNFSQKHIGAGSDLKVEKLAERIDVMASQFKQTIPYLQEMSRTKTDREDLFLPEFIDLPQYIIDEAVKTFEEGRDDSVWGYYNSLTSAITHNLRRESPQTSLNYGQIAWKTAGKLLRNA